jgi:hypothetical protein
MLRIVGIAAFALLYHIFSVGLCGASADASTTNVSFEQAPESAAGLRSQLETILKASQESDSRRFDELTAALRIPDSSNWFTDTFGKDIGEKLAATYSDSWNDYKRDVDGMFRDSGTRKHTHASVEKFSISSLARRDAFIESILQNAKDPVVLYTAVARRNLKSDALPGVYIFAQGSFRVVNWRTFYDLPNVKPTRIHVDRRIAPVNQVSQPDARPGLHDSVMVHVVIDRDGVVALAEAVSGPPERFESAVHTIRSFRFKPQTRDGAPVEIDTTIPVEYLEVNLKMQ